MKGLRLFFTKEYWSAFLSKLCETLISVKLWIILISTLFAYQMLNICIDIKDTAMVLAKEQIPQNELINIFANWSSSILDTSLAMFTGVIVVITISNESFKHAKINTPNADNNTLANDINIEVQNIKDRME